jgi:hypothetical protein
MSSVFTPIPPEKGFHEGIEALYPPHDDTWWDGEFGHFDFDSLFNEIAKSVPASMASESFQKNKWVLKSNDSKEPELWNEYASGKITFFSDYFLESLMQGKS